MGDLRPTTPVTGQHPASLLLLLLSGEAWRGAWSACLLEAGVAGEELDASLDLVVLPQVPVSLRGRWGVDLAGDDGRAVVTKRWNSQPNPQTTATRTFDLRPLTTWEAFLIKDLILDVAVTFLTRRIPSIPELMAIDIQLQVIASEL